MRTLRCLPEGLSMMHLPPLIQDLAIILMTAAVTTILFKALKQPVVLGYILAGLLVGPQIPLIPTVTDSENLKIWAEIGVIFLLFGLGLEFSFKKLMRVGFSATTTGVFEALFMLAFGYFVGRGFGWPKMDSLFLGGVLSVSSTTIIVRAIDELGMKTRRFVDLVFGVLIVEDLVAILLMVLLSAIAVAHEFSGLSLAGSLLQFIFFLTLWFLIGIYFLPLFFKWSRRYLNDETKLITAIGLCLMMVFIATQVGFSPALGAFVMGSIMAETREGASIEKLLTPVRDLFAAIFFVSVGMLIDIQIIRDNLGLVLILTLVTISGKLVSTTIGALVSGQSLRSSVQAGMCLAQIGEFSFIIATLGVSLKVVGEGLYPIAVAVSAITTFTTPYQIKLSDRVCDWIEKTVPGAWHEKLKDYASLFTIQNKKNSLQSMFKAHITYTLLNTVVVLALTFTYKKFVHPIFLEQLGEAYWVYVASTVGLVTVCIPFLWALILGPHQQGYEYSHEDLHIGKMIEIFFLVSRLSWCVFLIGFILAEFVSIQTGSLFILLGLTILLVLTGRYSEPFYRRLKKRFLHNLDDRELAMKENRPYSTLAPWDISLTEAVMSVDSDFVGKTLHESAIKEKYGAMVALIERGHKTIMAPDGEEVLMPQDRLFLIGSEEQTAPVKGLVEKREATADKPENYGLQALIVTEKSRFFNATIRDAGFREMIDGFVIGIERGGERILNPPSHTILLKDDLIWVVGDKAKIKTLSREAK